MMGEVLQAPFPWFGGKVRMAPVVWRRFGVVPNYVEPFFGSGSVLLNRPDWQPGMTETVNDIDGYLANFWRAVTADPESVAHWADWPVNENDLHARHAWLTAQKPGFVAQLEGDPDFYDPKIAGWWIWGICAWIGGHWCSGKGPWAAVDGALVNGAAEGAGISRQLPHLGDRGRGIHRPGKDLAGWFAALSHRLRSVRVCCGDWSRVCGPSPTAHVVRPSGITAVFLDPPYAVEDRDGVYTHDSFAVAHDVRTWAIEHGDDPRYRIALCGYDGEHAMPDGWTCYEWKAPGGYAMQGNGRGKENATRERVWFSPRCLADDPAQLPLFADDAA